MAPKKQDVGWDHAKPYNNDRRKPQCNYCQRVLSGGITRLKQHLAHHSGEVEGCTKVSSEIMQLMRRTLVEAGSEREAQKRRKEEVLQTLRHDAEYGYGQIGGDDNDDDDDSVEMSQVERRQLQHGMRESRRQMEIEREGRRLSTSDAMTVCPRLQRTTSQASGSRAGSSQARGPRPTRTFTLGEDAGQGRGGAEAALRDIDPLLLRSQGAKQKKLKNAWLPEGLKRAGKSIAKWFHYSGIPFNAADNPYFQTMLDTIAGVGEGVRGPSGRDIGGKYLQEEVEELREYLTTKQKKWPEYGCTIMCDGWSSRTKQPIINFMVYCDGDMIFHRSVDATNKSKTADYLYGLMNRVVDEVGESNVVHIVTDNEASYKAAGKMLQEKRKHLFWSPCAAHCIDLMLEAIGKMSTVKTLVEDARKITGYIYASDQLVNLMRTHTGGRDLLRPGITRFATEYIAIESLLRHKAALRRLFTSDEFYGLNYNSQRSRRSMRDTVANLVLTDQFWRRAEEVRIVMEPLVSVLKIVDQERKPTMPVIYEAMDRAKMAIKDSVRGWKSYWKIIDEKWERQLHTHLHAAGYFLNPAFAYGENFNADAEVMTGVKETIKRLEPDLESQGMALHEIKIYIEERGEFGQALAQKMKNKIPPAEWWHMYGSDAPHLRIIAKKVLSQTCSSSGCERNWSTFSLVHTRLRNRLAMAKLEQLVFVHYNLRLRVRNLMVKSTDDCYDPIDLNHIFNDMDILEPWIQEVEDPLLDGQDNDDWLEPEEDTGRSRRGDEGSDRGNDHSGDDQGGGDVGHTAAHGGRSSSDQDDSIRSGWGDDYYIATQDTDHGGRGARRTRDPETARRTRDPEPGIDAQRRHLDQLADFSSQETLQRRSISIDHRMRDMQIDDRHRWHGYAPPPYYPYGVPMPVAAVPVPVPVPVPVMIPRHQHPPRRSSRSSQRTGSTSSREESTGSSSMWPHSHGMPYPPGDAAYWSYQPAPDYYSSQPPEDFVSSIFNVPTQVYGPYVHSQHDEDDDYHVETHRQSMRH